MNIFPEIGSQQPAPATSSPSEGLPDDQQHLALLNEKLQLIRDRVAALVHGYATGFYLDGPGGVGKSHTVFQELRRLNADFLAFNSRMTGRGLFDELGRNPGSIHVLEDMESLLKDRNAQGVLRSALWAQRKKGATGPLPRLVTWTTRNDKTEVVFTGGIIIVANRPIDDLPELAAIKTRIACLHLEVTPAEMRALMRHVAGKGYEFNGLRLEPADCQEVCDFVIEQSASLRRSLDMRLLINSFHDRLQWEESDAACHWKDHVLARLRERSVAVQHGVIVGTREARKQAEQRVVAEILAATQGCKEQVGLWKERTGKSQAAWYRRLTELESK
jgi:hypothetical protein